MWTVRATVNRIVDGDTLSADLDLGWGIWRREIPGAPCRIRVLGVNTPERGEARYAEATNFLGAMCPVGSLVWVMSERLDSFGRALCHVTLPDGSDLASHYPAEWRL